MNRLHHIVRPDSTEALEIMLATDGVADDILPGKETAFVSHLIDVIESLSVDKRHEMMEEILSKWETPHSFDDKTVLIYHCALTGGQNENSKHADIC